MYVRALSLQPTLTSSVTPAACTRPHAEAHLQALPPLLQLACRHPTLNLLEPLSSRGNKDHRIISRYPMIPVQPYRTSSNNRVPEGYRTFSNYIFTGCVVYLYTSSGWFNCIEPPRIFSNHFIAEKARCVEFFHMSMAWFNYTEPSLTTSSQGEQSV